MAEAAWALDGQVDLITADCAYTWFVRQAFAGLRTPVLPSSLQLVDLARGMGESLAVVASSGAVLGGLWGEPPEGVRIVGLDQKAEWGRYQTYTVGTSPPLDRARMGDELIERLREDSRENGRPDAVVLECTGLPQFRRLIRRHYAGPVLDVASFVHHMLDVDQPEHAFFESGEAGGAPAAAR